MKNVLVVIDMQNDYIIGPSGNEESKAIVPNVKNKIKEYVTNNHPVYFTQDTHFRDYIDIVEDREYPVVRCIYNSFGWKITNDIGYVEEDNRRTYYTDPDTLKFVEINVNKKKHFNTIFKDKIGTFDWNSNNKFLDDAGISKQVIRHDFNKNDLFHDYYGYFGGSIEIVGLFTDTSVITNAIILRNMYPNTEIVVDASCCAGSTPENHEAALKVLKSCQIEVY